MLSGPVIDDMAATVDWPTTLVKCRAVDPYRGDFVTMPVMDFVLRMEVGLSTSMLSRGYSIAAINLVDFGNEISRNRSEVLHGDILQPGGLGS